MENNGFDENNAERPEIIQDYTYVRPDDPAVLKHANESFSRMGISVFEILLVATALQIILMVVMQMINPNLLQDNPVMLWVYTFVPMYCVAFPVGIMMLRRVEAYPPQQHSISISKLIAAFFVCLFFMYAGNMLGLLISALFNGGESVNPLAAFVSNGSTFVRLLVAVILGPLFEELVFRKLLIDRMNIYGERLAVFTSALIFGLFHGNLTQFFYAYLLGLVFGYVYLRSGNLIYSFILHAAVNYMGMILAPSMLESIDIDALEAISRETDPEAMMALLSPEIIRYMMFSMFIMIAFIAGFVIFLKNRKKLMFEPAAMEIPIEYRRRTVWRNPGMLALLIGCIAMMVFNTFAGALLQ